VRFNESLDIDLQNSYDPDSDVKEYSVKYDWNCPIEIDKEFC
jgi:hypothetical protein